MPDHPLILAARALDPATVTLAELPGEELDWLVSCSPCRKGRARLRPPLSEDLKTLPLWRVMLRLKCRVCGLGPPERVEISPRHGHTVGGLPLYCWTWSADRGARIELAEG